MSRLSWPRAVWGYLQTIRLYNRINPSCLCYNAPTSAEFYSSPEQGNKRRTHEAFRHTVALAVIDVVLIAYFLLVQLPENLTTVPLLLRFGPDLGLMLVIVLLLTAGWGTIRSVWVVQRWRTAHQTK